jgi:AcrR family transcriptional regulator
LLEQAQAFAIRWGQICNLDVIYMDEQNDMKNATTTSAISPADRREILLRTAEALFASKGIDAVSLNEINKAAGQRNTSALHYHFGSKEKLIDAIIYQEFDSIVARMNEEFDRVEAAADFDALTLIKAVTKPFLELLDTPRGINYLRIMVQLLDRNASMPFFSQPETVESVRARAFELAGRFFGNIPDSVKIIRLILFSSLMFRSLVMYAQFEFTGGRNVLGSRSLFEAVLCQSLEQVAFGPVSDEVISAQDAGQNTQDRS